MKYDFKPPKKQGKYTPCLNDKCFFTETPSEYCNVHHVFFGKNRKKSEIWGMKVYLKPEWHQNELYSAHKNIETDLKLKQYAQEQFEAKYDHDFFIEIFGKNYL